MTHCLSPATVQVVPGIVAVIFKSALRDRLVSTSPCVGSKLPKKVPVEIRPLSTATLHDLVDAVPDRYRALVVLAAGTGLRQGESTILVSLACRQGDLGPRFRSSQAWDGRAGL